MAKHICLRSRYKLVLADDKTYCSMACNPSIEMFGCPCACQSDSLYIPTWLFFADCMSVLLKILSHIVENVHISVDLEVVHHPI